MIALANRQRRGLLKCSLVRLFLCLSEQKLKYQLGAQYDSPNNTPTQKQSEWTHMLIPPHKILATRITVVYCILVIGWWQVANCSQEYWRHTRFWEDFQGIPKTPLSQRDIKWNLVCSSIISIRGSWFWNWRGNPPAMVFPTNTHIFKITNTTR